MDTDISTVSRKTLGRGAALGDLYDLRRDAFCGASLLNSEPPKATITSQDIPDIFCEYTDEQNYQSKLDMLDVEPNLKVSVLCGLLSLSGSGKYVAHEIKSPKVVCGTIIYRITTKEVAINLHHAELKQRIIEKQFTHCRATHVVSKIRYGAHLFVTFEKNVLNHREATESAAKLSAKLKKVLSTTIAERKVGSAGSLGPTRGPMVESAGEGITGTEVEDAGEGSGSVEQSQEYEHEVDSWSIKVFGDVIPLGELRPQSVEQVGLLISKVPRYVKEFNQGKGRPQEIELYPLKLLAGHFVAIGSFPEKLKKILDLAAMGRLEWEIDNILSQKQMLSDLVAEVYDFRDHVSQQELERCKKYQQSVNNNYAQFRVNLKQAILNVRERGLDTFCVDEVIGRYHKYDYSTDHISEFMETTRALESKMKFFQLMKSKDVEFLPKTESFDNFVVQHNRNDIYVLYYSETLREDDEKWQNAYQVFLYLVEERNVYVGTNDSNTPTSSVVLNAPQFLVVDLALHCPAKGVESSVHIAQYSNGRIVTNDVVKDKCSALTHNIISWSRIDKFGPSLRKLDIAHLICPLAIQSKCSPEPRQWVCHRCNDTMFYDPNGHFYCNCGGVLPQDCQFKCCDPRHGFKFIYFLQ